MVSESVETKRTRIAVVIPVGPTCKVEFVADTLNSVDFYLPGRDLFLCDDSGDGTAARAAGSRAATIVPLGGLGLRGGLYASLSRGFEAALAGKTPDLILRVDTDGLVASSAFVTNAVQFFATHPNVGAIGSYRIAYNGDRRSFRSSARRLLAECSIFAPRDPVRARRLMQMWLSAVRHGYTPGEHIMGGVTVYRGTAVRDLRDAGLLADDVLRRSDLQEDHLFGLALRSIGYRLADFRSPDFVDPMGVKWRGLPAAPKDLINEHRSLIHSTKYFDDLTEAQIRAVFASARVSA